jgi:hypothetical protein
MITTIQKKEKKHEHKKSLDICIERRGWLGGAIFRTDHTQRS